MTNPRSLRSRRDFERVVRSGRRLRTSSATFFSLARGDDRPPRLGLAVPAEVGGSVVRNRIKRRLRAAFRSHAPATGIDVVVRARPGAAVAPFQDLEEDLRKALSS